MGKARPGSVRDAEVPGSSPGSPTRKSLFTLDRQVTGGEPTGHPVLAHAAGSDDDAPAADDDAKVEVGRLELVMDSVPRPKLVVVLHPLSISPLEIVEAAQDMCQLLWVFDCTDPLLSQMLPLIRRLGAVIDTAGLTDAEVAARVALEHPDGIMTFSDPILLAAAIAEESDLPFHSLQTADLLSNKYRQRIALAQAGVPGPGFWPVARDIDPAELAHLVQDLSYPVVLKPQSGTGSQNTSRVDDPTTLLRLLAEAGQRSEDMLIEEVLAEAQPRAVQRFGEVLMVDSFVSSGRITHYALTGHFIPAQPFRGTGSFLPSHLDDRETKSVFEATDAALRALGVEAGFTNTDLILTPDGPRVLEVNGRIGGQIPELLTLAGEFPFLPEVMRFALGESDGLVPQLQNERVAFCAMYQAPMEARMVVELNGLDVVTQLPGITRIRPDRHAGDAIDWRRGTVSRLFSVYGVAKGHDHLYELYQEIQQAVVLRYEAD
jgi:biotin carboxylase